MSSYVPNRGDLVWLNFDPQAGHEQAGYRPAFVISPKTYNQKVGLAICCPVTNQIKGYPFEVILPEGIKTKGVILSDQVKNLDFKARKLKFIEHLSDSVTKEVLAKLKTVIV